MSHSHIYKSSAKITTNTCNRFKFPISYKENVYPVTLISISAEIIHTDVSPWKTILSRLQIYFRKMLPPVGSNAVLGFIFLWHWCWVDNLHSQFSSAASHSLTETILFCNLIATCPVWTDYFSQCWTKLTLILLPRHYVYICSSHFYVSSCTSTLCLKKTCDYIFDDKFN